MNVKWKKGLFACGGNSCSLIASEALTAKTLCRGVMSTSGESHTGRTFTMPVSLELLDCCASAETTKGAKDDSAQHLQHREQQFQELL